MWIVPLDDEIVESKVLNALHLPLELERREWTWRALQLLLERLNVVRIDVRIAQCVDKVPGLQISDVRNHVRQQGVAGDVEGHAETHVGRALVHLAGEVPVGDVELDEAVARR